MWHGVRVRRVRLVSACVQSSITGAYINPYEVHACLVVHCIHVSHVNERVSVHRKRARYVLKPTRHFTLVFGQRMRALLCVLFAVLALCHAIPKPLVVDDGEKEVHQSNYADLARQIKAADVPDLLLKIALQGSNISKLEYLCDTFGPRWPGMIQAHEPCTRTFTHTYTSAHSRTRTRFIYLMPHPHGAHAYCLHFLSTSHSCGCM